MLALPNFLNFKDYPSDNNEVREVVRLPKTLEQYNSQVYKRYYAFKEAHNKAQTIGNSAHLKASHKNLFEVIMHLYNPIFRRLVNSPVWEETDTPPSLRKTRRDLANLMHGGKRNVYNVLARLAAANIISVEIDKEFTDGCSQKGHANGYIITPNLYFVLGLPEYHPEISIFENPITEIPERHLWQKLPALNNQENKYNKRKAEEPTYPHQERDQEKEHQEKDQAETPVDTNQKNNTEDTQKNTGGGDFELVDNIQDKITPGDLMHLKFYGERVPRYAPKINVVPQQVIQNHEKVKMVSEFWNYAKKYLFPNREFNGEQTIAIKEIITTDVFGSFNGTENYNEWRVFLLMRQSEVDLMVAHNEKYDRQAYYPTAYFSKNYVKRGGFLSAHKWTMKERKKFTQFHHLQMLEKAKMSITCGKFPRNMKERINSPKELVEFWFNKLAKATNSPEIIENFGKFIANINLTRAWQA